MTIASHAPESAPQPPSRLARLKRPILFAVVFLGVELLHYLTRDAIAPLLVGRLTVTPAGWLLDTLFPSQQLVVVGNMFKTETIRFTIAQGCEGLESMLLVASAMIVMPMRVPHKVLGIVVATVVLWATNQARILGLFFVWLEVPGLFDVAHLLVGQTLVILVGVAVFVAWSGRFARSGHALVLR